MVVLPHLPHFHEIVCDVIGVWCAQWSPTLFREIEQRSWLHDERYEIPKVRECQREIESVEADALRRVAALHAEIDKLRKDSADWYTLLSGTGRQLVTAVIKSLESLGFSKVIDMDGLAGASGEALREDIQIHDTSPILIIDVKGVNGKCEDAEATQSEKHALMRMREFHGNVQPLTIINSERNLAPHERDRQPYRKEIVENAKHTNLGLMTTWDIFRLLRNKEQHGWGDEVIQPVFYRTGRIEPIPEHYSPIGKIVEVWKDAFGIVPSGEIIRGSRLAIEAGDLYQEVSVESLMVDEKAVNAAVVGSNCGVACKSAAKRFRKGMRVFLVGTVQVETQLPA